MDHIVALCAPLFRTQPPQAIPPPPMMGSSPAHWLLGAFPTLPLSQQSVAVDLPLRLVSVSCLFLYAQVCFLCGCSLCFLHKYLVSCVLLTLCSASLISSAVFLCPCLCLSAIRVIWQCPYWFGGSYPAGPTQVRRQSVRVVTSLLEVYIGGVQAVIS